MLILDQNNDPTPVKSDGCKRMENEIPAWFKPYKIVIRSGIGKGIKPQIEALNGQVRYFGHGWTIEDDHRLYPGEEAMLPYIDLNNAMEWPSEVSWVASGDLQPVGDIIEANANAAASTIKEERDFILKRYYSDSRIDTSKPVINHYGQTLHANTNEEKLESIMRILGDRMMYSKPEETMRKLILGILES